MERRDATRTRDPLAHRDQPPEQVAVGAERLLVELVDGPLEVLGDLEEAVEVPAEDGDDELDRAQQPDLALVRDLLSLLVEPLQGLGVARDHPAIAGDDLDRHRLVGAIVVEPDQGQLSGTVQDRCIRPPQLLGQRLRHALVDLQRVADDPEVFVLLAGDVDPQQLVVADALDGLLAQVDLAVAPVGRGEEGADAHRPMRLQPGVPARLTVGAARAAGRAVRGEPR